ncbi:hypothetical protein M2352_000942 [Azospirillum fermentarium]|uniref:Bbp19 family protein n=1 Tax=Azospirillum fermentarium TaxID=1233114 RepID=UPI0022280863|nr:hypothetical protein [Azospirillum fermentarium]MCW2245351.1 hypothetical protein [Azospirillum fermentarium]
MADPRDWPWEAPSAPAAGAAPAQDAASFARCFSTPDGVRVLAVLRALTLDRALGPDAPEPMLRHMEGQRHLVATILALAARGHGRP